MVISLADFDDLPLSSDTRKTPPIPSADSPETQPNPPNTEATEESVSQQNPPLPTPALDPALLALSPLTTNRTVSGDLTQLARHLALQKSLSKHGADELVQIAKVLLSADTPVFIFLKRIQQPLGEQLVWIAATQLSLSESILAVFSGEVSPTLLASPPSIVSIRADEFSETHQTGSWKTHPLVKPSSIQERTTWFRPNQGVCHHVLQPWRCR